MASSEPPVAAPDHAEELRDAIADLYGNGDIRFGSDSDRARRGARAALGALLAERQQDKQRIERLTEVGAAILAQARLESPEDLDGGWFIDGTLLIMLAAALAGEEDAENG